MINPKDELVKKEIHAFKDVIRQRTRNVLMLIFGLILLLVFFGANFFYASAFFDKTINVFSIREKKTDEEFGLPLLENDSSSFIPYNFHGLAYLDEEGEPNNWGGYSLGSANQLKNEPKDVPLFELSYFNENYFHTIIDTTDAIELEVLNKNQIQSYNFYKNKEVWDKAVFNAEKIFKSQQMMAGVEGQAIGFYERALIHLYMEDDINALSFYSLAQENDTFNEIPIDSRFGNLYYERGIVLFKQQSFDAGIKEFNSAILTNPELFQAYYLRGMSLLNKGDEKTAIADFNRCLSINPTYGKAFIALGYALYQQEDYGKAMEMLDKGIRLAPEDAMGYLYKGLVYEKINMSNGASQSYQKALKLMDNEQDINYIQKLLDDLK